MFQSVYLYQSAVTLSYPIHIIRYHYILFLYIIIDVCMKCSMRRVRIPSQSEVPSKSGGAQGRNSHQTLAREQLLPVSTQPVNKFILEYAHLSNPLGPKDLRERGVEDEGGSLREWGVGEGR